VKLSVFNIGTITLEPLKIEVQFEVSKMRVQNKFAHENANGCKIKGFVQYVAFYWKAIFKD